MYIMYSFVNYMIETIILLGIVAAINLRNAGGLTKKGPLALSYRTRI